MLAVNSSGSPECLSSRRFASTLLRLRSLPAACSIMSQPENLQSPSFSSVQTPGGRSRRSREISSDSLGISSSASSVAREFSSGQLKHTNTRTGRLHNLLGEASDPQQALLKSEEMIGHI